MALTIEDIARLSNVSRSTVSRVINGDEKVREETRRRVMEVIQEHNFHPNQAARRLAAGRTKVIGLVIPTGVGAIFNDPYFSQLIQGVSGACNAREYSVMLWLAEPEYERRMIRQIVSNGTVDGVVVSSTLIDDPIVLSLHNSNLPFVLIGRHLSVEVNSIDVDNLQGAKEAALHLIACGRKRLGAINGPQNQMAGQDRAEGFKRALQEKSLVFDTALSADGDFTEPSGYAAMQKLLPAHPDGIFAANDMLAAGALRAIREAGLKVPQDIALVGFDDIPMAAQFDPPLTTIRQPIKQMGALAVETLIEAIQQPESPLRRIILQPELIVRASCGAG